MFAEKPHIAMQPSAGERSARRLQQSVAFTATQRVDPTSSTALAVPTLNSTSLASALNVDSAVMGPEMSHKEPNVKRTTSSSLPSPDYSESGFAMLNAVAPLVAM